MTRVCLISLPNPILISPMMNVPLGLLYVGAALEKDGHKICISDMRAEHNVNMDIVPKEYDIYGVSATTGEYHFAKEVARALKNRECGTNSTLVLGGPHATHKPLETLSNTDYNVICIGEGENTMLELANSIGDGENDDNYLDDNYLFNIDGIAFKDGSDIVINRKRELIKDLDSIPFPARHLLPYDHIFVNNLYYGERYGRGEVATSFITMRGCPSNCSYCANWDKGLRLRSIENVIKEVEECIEVYKCRHFRIVDDEFGIPEARGIKLCEALSGLDIKFRTHTRADIATPELMSALKKAGCDEVSFGIETPDENILRMVNKRQNLSQCINAIKYAKDAGLKVKTYLMVCLPGETWNSVEKMKRFVETVRPDKWTLSTLIPYPGCDIEKNPLKYGIKNIDIDYENYWLYQDDPMFETDAASKKELKEHRIELMNWLLEYDKRNKENKLV